MHENTPRTCCLRFAMWYWKKTGYVEIYLLIIQLFDQRNHLIWFFSVCKKASLQENMMLCEWEGGAGWLLSWDRGVSFLPGLPSRSPASTPHNLCTRWPAAHAYSQSLPCAHSTLLLFHFVTWFCSQAALHWFANVRRTQLVWLRSRNPRVIRWTVPVWWEGALLARRGEASTGLATEPGRGWSGSEGVRMGLRISLWSTSPHGGWQPQWWRAASRRSSRSRSGSTLRSSGSWGRTRGMPGGSSSCCCSVRSWSCWWWKGGREVASQRVVGMKSFDCLTGSGARGRGSLAKGQLCFTWNGWKGNVDRYLQTSLSQKQGESLHEQICWSTSNKQKIHFLWC